MEKQGYCLDFYFLIDRLKAVLNRLMLDKKSCQENFSTLELFEVMSHGRPDSRISENNNQESMIDSVLKHFPGAELIGVRDISGEPKLPKEIPDELCIHGVSGFVSIPSPDLASMLFLAGCCQEVDPITHMPYSDSIANQVCQEALEQATITDNPNLLQSGRTNSSKISNIDNSMPSDAF